MPDLPDFHIPHAEKIDWMIATKGFAVEPVAAQVDSDPPVPGYLYSIGFPAAVGFPEVVVFGLTPSAANGLVELVAGLCRDGTPIPVGVEVTGLFDSELRAAFLPVDVAMWGDLFVTGRAWYRGEGFEVVQLVWPDRRGFLPYEPGFDQRLRYAQPVIGTPPSHLEET